MITVKGANGVVVTADVDVPFWLVPVDPDNLTDQDIHQIEKLVGYVDVKKVLDREHGATG